jgi:hypothetical protein
VEAELRMRQNILSDGLADELVRRIIDAEKRQCDVSMMETTVPTLR